jgi:hypothetical protein
MLVDETWMFEDDEGWYIRGEMIERRREKTVARNWRLQTTPRDIPHLDRRTAELPRK